MNTEDLDDRIRALVAGAVADAPPAPELPDRRTEAAVLPLEPRRRRPAMWVLGGAAAAALLVGVVLVATDDDPDRITTSSSTDVETTTVEPTTTGVPDSTPTSIVGGPYPWPRDLVGILASERGVERVYADGDLITVEQSSNDPQRPLDVAFELPDGEVLAGGSLMDVSPDLDVRFEASALSVGTPWVYTGELDGDNLFPLDVELPEGVTGGIARLTHGLDIYVGQTVEADGWWRPVLFTSDGTADVQFWEDLGVAGPFSPQADPPRLFSVSPTGSTIAWVQSGELFIADGRVFEIPDGSKVIELDMTDDFIALSRASTPASLLDLRTGEWYDSPALGRLTISFRDPGTPSEPVPTTSEAPPVSEPAAVVTAGSDGVWEQTPEGWVQWASEPMAVAVKAPNGWMIMQRVDKYADGSTPADTLPLVVRSPGDAPEGLFDILFPGADVVPGRYEVHDAATIGGRPTLIYERQAAESTGLDTPQGSLLALDLDSGYLQVISDNFGGWEQGSSRMHLGETGLIVGESSSGISHALTSFHIYGGIPLEPADMGFDADYSDCTNCPRLFSLSRDGLTFAWLDGSTLRRWDLEHGEALPPVELGDEVLAASDLTVTDDYVVIDRAWYGQEAPPLLIPLDGSSPTELKGLHAT